MPACAAILPLRIFKSRRITIIIFDLYIVALTTHMHYIIEVKINQCEALYIINSAGIAYHQNEVLYIIKPQGRYSPKGADEIQGRRAALDDIHDCVVMIYKACGLDKQKRNFW